MLLQAFVWSCWVNAVLSLAMAGFLVCSGRATYLKNLWIESHGGRIWAESEGKGKGATFTFTLPRGDV